MVVADHELSTRGEHPAEALLPPEHRAAHPVDEEDRRVGRIAKRLGAQLDAVRFDDSLRHESVQPKSDTFANR